MNIENQTIAQQIKNEYQIQKQLQHEAKMRSNGLNKKLTNNNKLKEQGQFGRAIEARTVIRTVLQEQADGKQAAFIQAIEEARDSYKWGAITAGKSATGAKWLGGLDAEQIALIASQVILNTVHQRLPQTTLSIKVGEAINIESNYQAVATHERSKSYVRSSLKKLKDEKKTESWRIQRVIEKTALWYKDEEGIDLGYKAWSTADKTHVGYLLIKLFMDSTGLIEFNSYKKRNNKKITSVKEVVGTPALLEYLAEREEIQGLLKPEFLPSLIKPREWNTLEDGGYFSDLSSSGLIRTDRATTSQIEPSDIQPVLDAVNSVQSTAWKVNQNIYDVVEHIIKKTEGMGVITEAQLQELPELTEEIMCDADKLEQFKLDRQLINEQNNITKSNRLRDLNTFRLAKLMKQEPEFYYPHFLDFRGRMYPQVSFLSPQGADLGKGLLTFAKGKKLGSDSAVSWLAIHTANTFGYDKASLSDRVQWTFKHSKQIQECAEDPVQNTWWTEADSPFQFLSACYEWIGYLKSGLEFVSHLPVQMDGSQNGIQHYSALMRCEEGGRLTNLVPSEKPADLYTKIAVATLERIQWHALQGSDEPMRTNQHMNKKQMAQDWLDSGLIDRKLVKLPTMTLTYNISKYGIRKQVKDTIRDKVIDLGWWERGNLHCVFLGDVIHQVLSEQAVDSTKKGMDFLVDLAQYVTNEGLRLKWKTPHDFPVVQNYHKKKAKRIKTNFFGEEYKLQASIKLKEVAQGKQKKGVAANFVHSLDSCHLQMTVNKASLVGIEEFMMIHDSFGTHASDCDLLSEILREQFVELHSVNIFEELLEQVKENLPEELHSDLPKLPEMGNLDIKEVLKSDYFFC